MIHQKHVFALLDPSTVSTVDHYILIDRLEKWVDLSSTVLNWIKSKLG